MRRVLSIEEFEEDSAVDATVYESNGREGQTGRGEEVGKERKRASTVMNGTIHDCIFVGLW